MVLLGSSTLHRLGLAGNALGTDGAVRLILAAALGREMDGLGEGRYQFGRTLSQQKACT